MKLLPTMNEPTTFSEVNQEHLRSVINQLGIETEENDIIQKYRQHQNEDNITTPKLDVELEKHMHPHMSFLLNQIQATKLQLEEMKKCLEVESRLNKIMQNVQTEEHQFRIKTGTEKRDLTKKKLEEATDDYQRINARLEHEKALAKFSIEDLKGEEVDLTTKKEILIENRNELKKKVDNLEEIHNHWKTFKDISQFAPRAQQQVLRFLDPFSFVCILRVCKAWNLALSKPESWMQVQRSCFRKRFYIPPQRVQIQLAPIHHAIIQIKMDPVKNRSFLSRKSDIQIDKEEMYRTCMETVQKRMAQASQDFEDLEVKVKADDEIIQFLQNSMEELMAKSGEFEVVKFKHKTSLRNIAVQKKAFSKKITELDEKIASEKALIEEAKINARANGEERQKKLRLQKDLLSESSQNKQDEAEKLKSQKSKLIKVLVKLRKDLKTRNKEVTKLDSRVGELLERRQNTTSEANKSDFSDLP